MSQSSVTNSRIKASRYHDFSAGHRVFGHESKCAHLHGHNYRVHFDVEMNTGALDAIGRVVDFSVIKDTLCQWLEIHWDHQMLIWINDPWLEALQAIDKKGIEVVSFNPTAENMAHHLVTTIAPHLLAGSGLVLVKCTVEETRKCSASCEVAGIPIMAVLSETSGCIAFNAAAASTSGSTS